MKKQTLATVALAGVGAGIAAAVLLATKDEPLETVEYVDLDRYLGKWYEIAAFPQSFEKGCTYTTAEYSVNDDNTIAVKNTCLKNGNINIAEGTALVADGMTNAKLEVSFFWPFSGKYWIIELAHDYSYAVVGHPNRNYLWILNRDPQMDNQTYNYLVVQAAKKGFDVRRLVKTQQG